MSSTYTPPEGVRAEARRALKWIADGHAGSGFTDTGRKRAADLARGAAVSRETIGRIANYLARHQSDKKGAGWSPGEDGYPSPGRVAWAAWGGDPAASWTDTILQSEDKTMNDIEMKTMTATVESAIDDSAAFPHGGFTAVASTPSLDRDGDMLAKKEWIEPLPDHITIDIDHEMSVRGTVGSARPYFDADGRLMIEARFASTPQAQETRTLINEGHIRTVSVAFMTDKSKKSGEPRRELLNVGIVAIPSNRDAVIVGSKAAAASHEQNIHDAAVALGAMCAGGYKAVKAAGLLDDEAIDPRTVLAGIDAILDQAQALCVDCDMTALPPEVAQALSMLFGVGPAIDELLETLGIPDPDDSETEEEEMSGPVQAGALSAEKSAAAAADAAAAAEDSADVVALRARSLAFLLNKTSTR